MSSFPETGKVRAAVITGFHPYDVPGFQAAFKSMESVDVYPQHMDDFVTTPPELRAGYEVLVFYNFHQETPSEAQGPLGAAQFAALSQLGETDQGLLILHHSILAYMNWQFWADLVGIPDRTFGYHMGQTVKIEIADPDHPITRGLEPWEMGDETYTVAEPGDENHVLLTCEHPLSMKTIGWTRQYMKARVFCFQSGHDNLAFAHPNFRTVMERGIQWLARKL